MRIQSPSTINTNRLGLECINSLDMAANIISDGLEILQDLISLVNDGLVLEDGAVV